MSGDIEAAADLATGAVLAHSVEPTHGSGRADSSARCANCGETLIGKHCHGCGQAAHVHRTLGAFWHDFTHSILHFEGKFWRTLPMLVFRPGALTRRYIHGERAKFVSPLASFLFSVFLLFAAINWIGSPFADPDGVVRPKVEAQGEFGRDMAAALAKARATLAAREKAGAPEAELAPLREEVRDLERADAFADGIDAEDFKADGARDFQLGNPALEAKLRHAFENPQLLFYKMQSSAYKFSWAIIPISLPFVWLLFAWRRQFHGYDHIVFITYSLSFMSLLLVALSIFGRLGPLAGLRDPLFALVPPIHMFAQVKGAYSLRWVSALWRTLALLVIAIVVLLVFGALLLALGVA